MVRRQTWRGDRAAGRAVPVPRERCLKATSCLEPPPEEWGQVGGPLCSCARAWLGEVPSPAR